jgi:hypothetical protein
MKIRKWVMALAIGIGAMLATTGVQTLRADDGCDASSPEDYCEYDGDGGGDMSYEDGRTCGDYDKLECGGTTTTTTYRCTRWAVTSGDGSVNVLASRPTSISAGLTLTCAEYTATTRTINNRWDQQAYGWEGL